MCHLKRVCTCGQELIAPCGQLAHSEWLFSNKHAARAAFSPLLVGNYTSGMLRGGRGQGRCVWVEGWRGNWRSPRPRGRDRQAYMQLMVQTHSDRQCGLYKKHAYGL